jgi:uncharacterized protein YcgI (DUF1989 family)
VAIVFAPAGRIVTHVEIPAQSGRAINVPKRGLLEIEDPHGTQIGDLWALVDGDVGEWLSVGHTRLPIDGMFPRPGQAFWSNRMRPILTLVEDRSPGLHDTLCPPCGPDLYRWLGEPDDHPSCQCNFLAALDAVGVATDVVPASVNLFQDSPLGSDGVIDWRRPAASRPGDAVVFRAEVDLLVVVTSCSMDVEGVNGDRCTPLAMRVTQDRSSDA